MLKLTSLMSLWLVTASPVQDAPSLVEISPLVDREIAVLVEVDLKAAPKKDFSSCVPRESISFPKVLTTSLSEKIFTKKELSDFKACKPDSCKHNFLDQEIEWLIKSGLKSDEDYKNKFFSFYKNRVERKTPILLQESRWKISSAVKPISFCEGAQADSILNQRPLPKANFRLSVVQYDSKMRPTTRLLQGIFFQDSKNKSLCFIESLLFSNHYDLDRIEAWELNSKNELRLLVRHRIDLLSTWFRRLQKPRLQKSLEKAALSEVLAAKNCLISP